MNNLTSPIAQAKPHAVDDGTPAGALLSLAAQRKARAVVCREQIDDLAAEIQRLEAAAAEHVRTAEAFERAAKALSGAEQT